MKPCECTDNETPPGPPFTDNKTLVYSHKSLIMFLGF